MVTEKQRKAREKFIKNWAGKKRVTKTGGAKRLASVARIGKLKAYDMKNKHKNWLRAKAAGISKKEFEKFWKNFTKLY